MKVPGELIREHPSPRALTGSGRGGEGGIPDVTCSLSTVALDHSRIFRRSPLGTSALLGAGGSATPESLKWALVLRELRDTGLGWNKPFWTTRGHQGHRKPCFPDRSGLRERDSQIWLGRKWWGQHMGWVALEADRCLQRLVSWLCPCLPMWPLSLRGAFVTWGSHHLPHQGVGGVH
jgi:hypothetical protein